MATSKAVLRYDGQGRPVYRSGMAPEGLATASQLRSRRLSPAGLAPAAWLYYSRLHHRECALYEEAQARPIRPLTERQRQVLAEGRALANTVLCRRCGAVRVSVWGDQYCGPCGHAAEVERYEAWERRMQEEAEAHALMVERDGAAAQAWAAEVLADPLAVVLDAETTGLGAAFLVEVSVVAVDGTVLLDTLVDPGMPIPAAATAIHGITDAMVIGAPRFADVLPELTRLMLGRRVVIYNAAFDRGILRTELDRHYRLVEPSTAPDREWAEHPSTSWWMRWLRTECAMHEYARWIGDWSNYWGGYRWQALHGGHRARQDCVAVLERLARMAVGADEAKPGRGPPARRVARRARAGLKSGLREAGLWCGRGPGAFDARGGAVAALNPGGAVEFLVFDGAYGGGVCVLEDAGLASPAGLGEVADGGGLALPVGVEDVVVGAGAGDREAPPADFERLAGVEQRVPGGFGGADDSGFAGDGDVYFPAGVARRISGADGGAAAKQLDVGVGGVRGLVVLGGAEGEHGAGGQGAGVVVAVHVRS